jgi:phosphoribosyl 1,2-cyclic phosphodiesterase
MMQLCVLGSGSSGNASIVKTDTTTILIDAGFSALRLKKRMMEVGIHPDHLDAILITHDHHDHCSALAQFSKKHEIPVMCSTHTCQELRYQAPNVPYVSFEKQQPFTLGDLTITAFPISHDATDPVGFRVESGNASLGYVSDTGCVTPTILKYLQGVQSLYLESNYDPELLRLTTKRPMRTKQRIASRFGHLSNDDAAGVVNEIAHPDLKHIVLAHLSSECNREEIALDTMANTLQRCGLNETTLCCARQHEILPWFSIL